VSFGARARVGGPTHSRLDHLGGVSPQRDLYQLKVAGKLRSAAERLKKLRLLASLVVISRNIEKHELCRSD